MGCKVNLYFIDRQVIFMLIFSPMIRRITFLASIFFFLFVFISSVLAECDFPGGSGAPPDCRNSLNKESCACFCEKARSKVLQLQKDRSGHDDLDVALSYNNFNYYCCRVGSYIDAKSPIPTPYLACSISVGNPFSAKTTTTISGKPTQTPSPTAVPTSAISPTAPPKNTPIVPAVYQPEKANISFFSRIMSAFQNFFSRVFSFSK